MWNAEELVFEVVPLNLSGQEIFTQLSYTWSFKNLISVPCWKFLFSLSVFANKKSFANIEDEAPGCFWAE